MNVRKRVKAYGYALLKDNGTIYVCDDMDDINASNSVRIVPLPSKYIPMAGDRIRVTGTLSKTAGGYIIDNAKIERML